MGRPKIGKLEGWFPKDRTPQAMRVVSRKAGLRKGGFRKLEDRAPQAWFPETRILETGTNLTSRVSELGKVAQILYSFASCWPHMTKHGHRWPDSNKIINYELIKF